MSDIKADDLAYDIIQNNQDAMARYIQRLTEDLAMHDFSYDEQNHVDSELTRDLEQEAMKALGTAIQDVLDERPEPEEKISLEMSDETRAWARNQLLIYGNVIFRVEDGQLLPGMDFSELNIVLGNAESTLTKVRDALMKKVNGG
jgi:hypothetical protein